MLILLQILFVNLVVSCDNVGVIALATKNLPEDLAVKARRIGVGLSLLLKLLFVLVVGFLFDIQWLHIRIIGGVLLLYVTFNMIRQAESGSGHAHGKQLDSSQFSVVLLSIVAADISMSLDNVIAVLSIVTSDGSDLGLRQMLIILAGLVFSIPLLLWFSGTVTRWMERYAILTYVCGGYLVYTAVRMIFEDEMVHLFLSRINFHLTFPTAVLCGLLVVGYGFFARYDPAASRRRRPGSLFFISVCVALQAVLTMAVILYLSTNPILEGHTFSVELVYRVAPSGGNSIFMLGETGHRLTIFGAVYVSSLMARWGTGAKSYSALFRKACRGMLLFLGIQVLVCFSGMTYSFGLGELRPEAALLYLMVFALLLFSYMGIFCLIACFVSNRFVCLTLSLIYVFVEHVLAEIGLTGQHIHLLRNFVPGFNMLFLLEKIGDSRAVLGIVFQCLFVIGITAWLAHGPKGTPTRQRRGTRRAGSLGAIDSRLNP